MVEFLQSKISPVEMKITAYFKSLVCTKFNDVNVSGEKTKQNSRFCATYIFRKGDTSESSSNTGFESFVHFCKIYRFPTPTFVK